MTDNPKWEVEWDYSYDQSTGYYNVGPATIKVPYQQEEEAKANANLISAAPDLLEACELQQRALDVLFAKLIRMDEDFRPTKSGLPWDAIEKGMKAVKKAKGV